MRAVRAAVMAGALVLAAAAGCAAASTPRAAATGGLVYICQQLPCSSNQELEVFDKNGAPIFSVPEYGGPGVFGDNFQVYPPGTVFRPAVTLGYESPGLYDSQHGLASGCTAPSRWLEPHGDWTCQSGRWVKVTNLP